MDTLDLVGVLLLDELNTEEGDLPLASHDD